MRGNANILLDNESVRPRMKAKSEEVCRMRVESLKKDVFKKDNKQNKKMQEKFKATINMFLLMIPGHFGPIISKHITFF